MPESPPQRAIDPPPFLHGARTHGARPLVAPAVGARSVGRQKPPTRLVRFQAVLQAANKKKPKQQPQVLKRPGSPHSKQKTLLRPARQSNSLRRAADGNAPAISQHHFGKSIPSIKPNPHISRRQVHPTASSRSLRHPKVNKTRPPPPAEGTVPDRFGKQYPPPPDCFLTPKKLPEMSEKSKKNQKNQTHPQC
jgi:hypothetical protein